MAVSKGHRDLRIVGSELRLHLFSLPHAPLPDWSELAAAMGAGIVTDAELARPWIREGESPFWLSRTAWSLLVIAMFRSRVTGNRPVRVWLPGYFCNESLAPLRAFGAELAFYPVLPDCTPALDACRAMLKEARPDLVVVVHFFGDRAPAAGLRQLAHENGAWFIEDAAHVLLPTVDGIGTDGDFVLYSPHKLLAISDGALLVARSGAGGGLSDALLVEHDFNGVWQSLVKESTGGGTRPYAWLGKRVLQRLGVRRTRKAPAFQAESAPPVPLPRPEMSTLARRLLLVMLPKLSTEAKGRTENQREWARRLASDHPEFISVEALPRRGTPYLAGFSFGSASAAENAYTSLALAGLPVTTWPDLPPEVLRDRRRYENAFTLRSSRIFLPVHASVTPAAIGSALERLALVPA